MGNVLKKHKTNSNNSNNHSFEDIKGILENIDEKQIDVVPYKNIMIPAKISSVYDGDTVTAIILYGNQPMKIKLRIIGIDAPEKNSKNELEKRAAIAVTNLVKNFIENKVCFIQLEKPDKYARVLGDVYFGDNKVSLSKYLLNNNYVRSYDGTKKPEWTAEELQNIVDRI